MSPIGAFFDVDRTLVSCNTGRLFLRDLRRRGEISFFRALRALVWMAKYHLSLIDLQWVAARIASQMEGWVERDFEERCRRWVEEEVLPLVAPGPRLSHRQRIRLSPRLRFRRSTNNTGFWRLV